MEKDADNLVMKELPTPLSSPADKKKYLAFKLSNGLQVVLIHDPEIGTGRHTDASPHTMCTANQEVVPEAHEDLEEAMSLLSSSGSDTDGSEDREDDHDALSRSESDDGSDGHIRLHHPHRDEHTYDDHGPQGGGKMRRHHYDHISYGKSVSAGTVSGTIKKSAAAMCVGVGYYSDPDILEGLSHYLEHMLFMGSEKYPDENDYDAFLSANAGTSNAFTEEEMTTFHFDCAPDVLEQALDRFAQFFICPLFKKEALEREVMAVDNEFSGVLQNDGCRLTAMRSDTCRKPHPFQKFGWGNLLSLAEKPRELRLDVREELLKHYKSNYSAERMNLVVIGGENLETMKEWVTERFCQIPCGKGPRTRYDSFGGPFSKEIGMKGLHIIPAVKNDHKLHLSFQLPCLDKLYNKKVDDYLSHLLGHEGRGSLLAYLKFRGWATELCAGIIEQTTAAYLFEISVTLTDSGLNEGYGCGTAVAESVFQYISMLKDHGPQKWAWDEMAAISEMKWRFLEEEDPGDYVVQISSDMHIYPIHHVLMGSYIHEDFDPVKINEILDMMLPEMARLDLQTSDYQSCCERIFSLSAEFDDLGVSEKQEPWFGFTYCEVRLPKAIITKWGSQKWSNLLTLPPQNPYLPSDFSLRCHSHDDRTLPPQENKSLASQNLLNGNSNGSIREENVAVLQNTTVDVTAPRIVLDHPGLRIWYKMDTIFRVPRSAVYFRINSVNFYSSPRNAAASHLIVKLLEDSLCEEAYLADVAGIHYGIWFEGSSGIDIKVDGFNHRLPLLVKLIFQTLGNLRIEDEKFYRVKESLIRSYKNTHMNPLRQSTFLRLRVLKAKFYDLDTVLMELVTLSSCDVRNMFQELLQKSQIHVESLVVGNFTAEEAISIGKDAQSILECKGSVPVGDQTMKIPEGNSFLLPSKCVNPEEDNSTVEVYYQFGSGVQNPKERAIVDLIDQLTHEPCYDTLRTKEQLGYVVASSHRYTHGVVGFDIIVQSGTYNPSYLESRVDSFLDNFAKQLEDMDGDKFEQHKSALIAEKLTKDHNLVEEADKAWDALVNRGADFLSRQNEVEALKLVQKAEIAEFFNDKITSDAPHRKRLSVQISGKQHSSKEIERSASCMPSHVSEVIYDIDSFKSGLECFPPVEQQGI